jgi:alanine dehydrogenase
VPGVPRGNVVILGAGVVGMNALRTPVGHGADVAILDINVDRLRHVEELYGNQVVTVMSNSYNVEQAVQRAELLIGAVLLPGARAPVLVSADLVAHMKEGAVIVDVAVDQGACVETIRPTTLAEPIYRETGVVHYGVTNMPALVPRTSTFALTNATLPYVLQLAGRGIAGAIRADGPLAGGVNVWRGAIVHPAVAAFVGETPTPLDALT